MLEKWNYPFYFIYLKNRVSQSLSLSQIKPVQMGWLLLAPEDTDFSSSGHRKRVMMALAVLEIISIRYRSFICYHVVRVALIFLWHLCYRNGRGDILCFTSMGFYATLWMRWWGLICSLCSVSKLFILCIPLMYLKLTKTPSLIPDQKC